MPLVERPYAVIGSTAEELAASIALLGPSRGGRRFAAYTDWTVTWRYDAAELVASVVDVSVTGTITIPVWTPLKLVAPDLIERWQRLIEALRRHEEGHALLADRAAAEIRAALAAVPKQADATALRREVERAADAVMRRVRADELQYDAETRDGATQGASTATLFAVTSRA